MSKKDSSVLETIYRIEQNLPVENLISEGIYLWPMIRIQLALENFYSEDLKSSSSHGVMIKIYEGILKPLLAQWKIQIFDRKHNDKLRKTDVLFLSDSINRRIKDPTGAYIDIFTELIGRKILSENQTTWISLERSSNNFSKYPRAEKSKLIIASCIWQKIIRRLHTPKQLSRESTDVLHSIKFEMHLSGHTANSVSLKNVQGSLSQILISKKFFMNTLRVTKPSAVIQANWYAINAMAMRLACHEMKVPFIDYQHGLQGPAHIAYGRWLKPFSKGISLFPDIFLCWTPLDMDNIKKWLPQTKGQAFCVGNILVNEMKAGNVTFYKNDLYESLKVCGLKNILLTLQPIYFLNDIIMNQIAAFEQNTYWWIRLHPSMGSDTQKYKSQLETRFPNLRFNISEATSLPLPFLLSQVDLHITFNSSVVIEAAMMGIQSIVLDTDLGYDTFRHYVDSGIVLLGIQDILPTNKLKRIESDHSNIAEILKTIASTKSDLKNRFDIS